MYEQTIHQNAPQNGLDVKWIIPESEFSDHIFVPL